MRASSLTLRTPTTQKASILLENVQDARISGCEVNAGTWPMVLVTGAQTAGVHISNNTITPPTSRPVEMGADVAPGAVTQQP